jgi:Zn finger protein HypA/HybF involved in hydrogenase expression
MVELSEQIRRRMLALRAEMLVRLNRSVDDTVCCEQCLLPYPEGDYESYDFCPWCMLSIRGLEERIDESRKVILDVRFGNDEIQCGECGGEYEQPTLYPFKYCPHCGAHFAEFDELLMVLPFTVR